MFWGTPANILIYDGCVPHSAISQNERNTERLTREKAEVAQSPHSVSAPNSFLLFAWEPGPQWKTCLRLIMLTSDSCVYVIL